MPPEFEAALKKKRWYRLKEGKRHNVRPDNPPSKHTIKLLPGQVCQLTEHQFKAFRDKFEGPVTVDRDGTKLVDLAEQSPGLTMEHAGGGWYDVLSKGEPINDKKLREVDAKALVKASMSDTPKEEPAEGERQSA